MTRRRSRSQPTKKRRKGKTPKPRLAEHAGKDGQLTAAVGPGAGIRFVETVFPTAQAAIRIASAYFSLQGYKLAREHIRKGTQLRILVGREDGLPLKSAVIDEILRDLARPDEDIWDAVSDLVERIRHNQFFIKDARQIETRFHCKFYICDDHSLWHGSANYTKSGLSGNAEQASLSRDKVEVEQFTDWYDEVAAGAVDLLADLLRQLERWLQLELPFDVYLTTLRQLYQFSHFDVGPQGHQPLYYQRAIVRAALNQIERHGGAIAVVATGLGKTVIGAEIAYRLEARGDIKRVILFAPRAVHDDWRKQLVARDSLYDPFTAETLFRSSSPQRHHQIAKLEEKLGECGPETLIILDEAHVVKNQLLRVASDKPSLVLRRLNPPVNRGSPILLLTATPFGTNIKNLASLLALLPFGPKDPLGFPQRWAAKSVREFTDLPVVSTFGFPDILTIARRQGDLDEERRPFVHFGKQRRYLPRLLHLCTIAVVPPLEKEMYAAFHARCFVQSTPVTHRFFDEDGELKRGSTDGIANTTRAAWLSSPAALLDTLKRNLATPDTSQIESELLSGGVVGPSEQTELAFESPPSVALRATPLNQPSIGYSAMMATPLEKRAAHLEPLIAILEGLGPEQDSKLQELASLIHQHCKKARRKAIVFVKKWRTALHLERHLRSTFGVHVPLECTAMATDGRPRLKSAQERDTLRRRFSPQSHNEETPARPIDLLISTDADSVGVSLQDADVVINYDLPEGIDVLFQRAGRVLRMTVNPEREVFFYTFVPAFRDTNELTGAVRAKALRSMERLSKRHARAVPILRAPVLSPAPHEKHAFETTVTSEEFFASDPFFAEDKSLAATAAQHVAVLEQHAQRAQLVPLYPYSARYYHREEPRVFVLVRHDSGLAPIVMNVAQRTLEDFTELGALDLIACTPEEQPALVLSRDVERAANEAVRLWCANNGREAANIEKICAMYLEPQESRVTTSELLA